MGAHGRVASSGPSRAPGSRRRDGDGSGPRSGAPRGAALSLLGRRSARHTFSCQTCKRCRRCWGHWISYDPARFPRYLPEAYCLCRGCLTGPFGEEDFRFRSTPVYMPAVVLRRTSACAGGRSVYTEAYVTVPVGCTCIPEPEKDTASVNSSIDKQAAKPLLGPSNEPDSP